MASNMHFVIKEGLSLHRDMFALGEKAAVTNDWRRSLDFCTAAQTERASGPARTACYSCTFSSPQHRVPACQLVTPEVPACSTEHRPDLALCSKQAGRHQPTWKELASTWRSPQCCCRWCPVTGQCRTLCPSCQEGMGCCGHW